MLAINDMEQQLSEAVQNNDIPGFALSVFNDSEVLYEKSFGLTNWEESNQQITENTLFRIGSVSKSLTATLIMKLVEEGLLELDVPITNYIEKFTLQNELYAKIITLRMLLSHTSGLPNGGDIEGPRDQSGWETYIDEVVSNLELENPPGALYHYSNHGFNIAGYVAQSVCQKPFAELMKEYVFQPLGMERTMYDPLEAMTYPLALAHEKTEHGEWKVQHKFAENVTNYPSFFAMSTLHDMSRFAMMHLNKGVFEGRTFLKPETIEEMHKKHYDNYTLNDFGSCLGVFTERTRGLNMLWHSGEISTYKCIYYLIPEKKLGFITMATQDVGWEIIDQLIETFIGPAEETEMKKVQVDGEILKSFEGNYLGVTKGYASVTREADSLVMEWNGEKLLLEAVRNDLFVGKYNKENISVGFRVLDSVDRYAIINGSPCKNTDIERRIAPVADAWKAYEGTYADGVFQFGFTTKGDTPYFVDEGQLYPCFPITKSLFYAGEYGVLEFSKDTGEGKVLRVQGAWRFEYVNQV